MPSSRQQSPRQEVLVVRGRLDRAGQFVLGRCRSTPFVKSWPVVRYSEVHLELLDANGHLLHDELAAVTPDRTCDPGDARRFRVLGYIGLRPDAREVRLVRGEIILWQSALPEAPTLEVRASPRSASRDKPLPLRLRYSPPQDNAHLTVIYQWGERRFLPIYIGKPSEVFEVNLAELPGGDACRLVMSYSNGLRSAQAATTTFKLPLLGPTVQIVSPPARTAVAAGTALVLEATAYDPELAGGADAQSLIWSVDGEVMGRGFITSVDGLAAGRHEIRLTYRGSQTVETSVLVSAKASEAAPADQWPAWNPLQD